MSSAAENPVSEPTEVMKALQTFAMASRDLRSISFDDDCGCLGWYVYKDAEEYVEIVRDAFQEIEALHHIAIEWKPRAD